MIIRAAVSKQMIIRQMIIRAAVSQQMIIRQMIIRAAVSQQIIIRAALSLQTLNKLLLQQKHNQRHNTTQTAISRYILRD